MISEGSCDAKDWSNEWLHFKRYWNRKHLF